jgi:hypothetical protein
MQTMRVRYLAGAIETPTYSLLGGLFLNFLGSRDISSSSSFTLRRLRRLVSRLNRPPALLRPERIDDGSVRLRETLAPPPPFPPPAKKSPPAPSNAPLPLPEGPPPPPNSPGSKRSGSPSATRARGLCWRPGALPGVGVSSSIVRESGGWPARCAWVIYHTSQMGTMGGRRPEMVSPICVVVRWANERMRGPRERRGRHR